MIEVKLSEAISAHRAFTRIGEADMPPTAAYRVGRLIAKLRSEQLAYQDAHVKLLKSKGGESVGGGAAPPPEPVREKDEADDAFAAREAAYKATMVEIADELVTLMEQTVKIDYDPIPLKLFEKTEPDPSDPKVKVVKSNLKPNDMADVLPFIKEE